MFNSSTFILLFIVFNLLLAIMRFLLISVAIGFISCSSEPSVIYDAVDSTSTNVFVQQITHTEYATENSFTNPTKAALEFQFIEKYASEGHMEEYITTFGYIAKKNTCGPKRDTIHYKTSTEKDKINYYIDNELTEYEVRKDNWLYLYCESQPNEPIIVREFDNHGNILKDISIEKHNVFLREYDIKDKDTNGYATLALTNWSQFERPSTKLITDYTLKNLKKTDSTVFIVEFDYVLNKPASQN